jgi:hypothetical protein
MLPKSVAAILVVAAISLLPTTQAGAAPITANVQDPAGDAPRPELDATAFSLTVDQPAGVIDGAVSLAAAPTADVTDSVEIVLGHFSRADHGKCKLGSTATIFIPDAEDMEAGFPWPFAQLYPPGNGSEAPFGFLPTYSPPDGREVQFASHESTDEVVDAIRSKIGRVNCAELATVEANTFETRDEITTALASGPVPRCEVPTTSAKGGRTVVARCDNVGGKVFVSWVKHGSRNTFSGKRKVSGNGRVKISTLRKWRGMYHLTIWKGDLVAGETDVKFR